MITEQETIQEVADALRYHRNDQLASHLCIKQIRDAINRFDQQPTMRATMEPGGMVTDETISRSR